jgi:hypothetical protein
VNASTLFKKVTFRVAVNSYFEDVLFDFELVLLLLDELVELFVVLFAAVLFAVDECVVRAAVVWLVCDDAAAEDDGCDDVLFFPDALERLRTLGASFTGAATVIVMPGRSADLLERRFHRCRSSTETPKRSATVTSVSPRNTR